jgi:RNA polymerase sigma factor (sigma-70 family)
MVVPDQNPTPPPGGPRPGSACAGTTFPWQAASHFAVTLALRIVGCHRRQLAEDIAQIALLRMWRRNPEIQVTWQALLSTIVMRLAWNRLRDEKTRRRHVSLDMEAVHAARDGEPGPPEQVGNTETMADLAALLKQLDEEFGPGTRAIVEFRAKGVPWEEIAGIVKLAARTCRNRHKSAIAWLNQRLSPTRDEGRSS